jgi:CO/xanthine dehydrogenase Mo-binding subunit
MNNLKIGRGISLGVHPTGLKGGGTPSRAHIQLRPDGRFQLHSGAVDIGQGSKTILLQMAADELGVPLEVITRQAVDTSQDAMCTGTFASRVTYMDGHAVIGACRNMKKLLLETAAQILERDAGDLAVLPDGVGPADGAGAALSWAELGKKARERGVDLTAGGSYSPGPLQDFDPEDGHMTAVSALAFHCCVAEVAVDTDTGMVEVTKLIHVWDVGRAVNPLLTAGQITGGSVMGLGFTLTEDLYPNYPSTQDSARTLADYTLPTFADLPGQHLTGIVEVPDPDGPHGVKGFSENSISGPPPAILSAIHDAIGVWLTHYPATPERVLRALAESQA